MSAMKGHFVEKFWFKYMLREIGSIRWSVKKIDGEFHLLALGTDVVTLLLVGFHSDLIYITINRHSLE